MPNKTYYPTTNEGRAVWWQNILDNGGPLLASVGVPAAEVSAIQSDAHWAVYSYGALRHAYDDFLRAVYQYADEIANGTPGGQLPAAPAVPAFPTAPTGSVQADFEGRREKWVQMVKHLSGYNATAGAALGLESTGGVTFNRTAYQCELFGMASLSAHTVGGKFRKAGGQLDGINLYGRKLGATAWVPLGRSTVTPFTASVPLAGSAPEQWEFMARAVARDEEFGADSQVSEVIVRP